MKKNELIMLIKLLKQNPNITRKIKIFAVVGLVGFFIVSGLVIWGSISLINYTTTETRQSLATSKAKNLIETQINKPLSFDMNRCYGKVQSLLSPQVWIDRPVLMNLEELKIACLGPK